MLVLKPRYCFRAKLSAEDVCRTENSLDRLDNISSSSYLLLRIKDKQKDITCLIITHHILTLWFILEVTQIDCIKSFKFKEHREVGFLEPPFLDRFS